MIRNSSRAVVVVITALAALSGTPVSAAEAGTLVATGTYSPGLPTTSCTPNQTVSWDGTAVFPSGTYAVHFDGVVNACAGLTGESGGGTLSGLIWGSLSYTRTGKVVTYSGVVTRRGSTETVTAWHCIRTWTSMNPVNSFVDYCHLVLDL